MNVVTINKIAEQTHNGCTVFFCKTDFIDGVFLTIEKLKHDVVLFTGNSDYTINENRLAGVPNNVKKWFCQNKDVENDLLVAVPMGLENHEHLQCVPNHGFGWEHAKPKHRIIKNASKFNNRDADEFIYANFGISTNTSIRSPVADICQSTKSINCEIASSHLDNFHRDYSRYVQQILKHKMVVCPRGNGPDCHRIWETLYLNRVPIVQKHCSVNDFKELPILYIEDWEELRDTEHINKKYKQVKNNKKTILSLEYWIDKIKRF